MAQLRAAPHAGTMPDFVKLVNDETSVHVYPPASDRFVRVRLGPAPHGVTIVGDLADIHRIFVEIDKRVSRLATQFQRSAGPEPADQREDDGRSIRRD